MSLVGAAYDSSDDDRPAQTAGSAAAPAQRSVVAAPDVSIDNAEHLALMLGKPTDTALTYNVPYEELSRPSEGPANPFMAGGGNRLKRKTVPTGRAEEVALSDATFTSQRRTFESLGYSRDPGAHGAFVGDLARAQALEGRDVVQLRPTRAEAAARKRKREGKGSAAVVDGEGAYKGPWARYGEEAVFDRDVAHEGADLASDEEWEEEATFAAAGTAPVGIKPATDYAENLEGRETTKFHGEAEHDYQGRTYMHVPQDLDVDLRKEAGSQPSFIPKKLAHTWREHSKAVTALRFIPGSGHLLLSASADGTAKLYDAHHARQLLRTYSGHSKALTDATFSRDGARFLTSSYDRRIKLWDTETGACVARFGGGGSGRGGVAHVVRFNPSAELGHEFLAGTSDKKIVQYDTRSGDVVQEYDHHLGPVNTVTFVDDARRFITTSDDKSLRAWEYGIPVPIKFVAEPHMFAMPRADPHPSGKYVAFQSGDNQIVVYAAGDRFRQNRKKAFRGHNVAGYAIDVAISPDGQFIASGDSGGYACFWDWKTCKMYHKFQAADGAVTCIQWHPQESSKVATAGLDGVIKYWD